MARLSIDSLHKLMASVVTRKTLRPETQEHVIITTLGNLHAALRRQLGLDVVPKNTKPITPRSQYPGAAGTNAYPPDLKGKIQDRLKLGELASELSQEYGISPRTLVRWKKELKDRGEISDE